MSPIKKIISNDGKPMLSARKTALRLHCAPDYVGKLCREGRLEGVQIKNAWFVDEQSIARFEENRLAARGQRSQELAHLRRQETREYQKLNGTFTQKVRARFLPTFNTRAVLV